jgi:lactate permease
MYRPILDSVGGSLFLTSLVAALPLATLFVLLGVLRMKAWLAALISLGVAVLVALVAYSMPVGQTLLAATEGAAFGFFPILWIVINAIWVYNMTVVTGHFDVLRRSFARVSDDQRIQAIIIAFCFGALLEALAGFGTPVAITSVMLIALGFKPIKAATVALVANTAPVAFGALAVPITTLATVTGLPQETLGSIAGRQTPILALFVPLALVFIIDGRRGVRHVWPAALLCGTAFAVAQFVTSNFLSLPLTDIVAALVGALATVVFLRAWRPAEGYVEPADETVPVGAGAARNPAGATGSGLGDTGRDDRGAGSARGAGRASGHGEPTGTASLDVDDADVHDSQAEVARAYAPYLIIILVFCVAQVPFIKDFLAQGVVKFQWPGLQLASPSGKPSTLPTFNLNWLPAAGTLMIISGLLTIPVIGISPAKALKAYFATYKQLATAIVTVMTVLALAYVMNASGQTATLGTWMAGAGSAFAILSPVLGWLGVAVTGSDTSSNSLFGALQVSAATQAGLDPALMAASNSSGGVLGKMISPQNLAIAAGAVGLAGREGDLFRKVIGWSLGMLVVMCLLVLGQSTVLSWMLP